VFLGTLLQDLRYGARSVLGQPCFSLVIVLTLALAIGANTVTFSFTNILVVRPLPVRDQDTLGWIFTVDPQRGGNRGSVSIPDLLDYRASLTSFESIAATTSGSLTMTGRGDAVALTTSRVTANLVETWGLRTIAGRPFAAGEDLPGAADVVMLSHRFWQRQFGGDPSVVGQALTLNGRPFNVIGVIAPEIEIGNLSEIDVWVPLTLDPSLPRDQRNVRVTARLKPGVSLEQAHAEVAALAQRLQQEHPRTNGGWGARVATTREAMTGSDTWVILALLMLVVAFVLLIACANIANLVLARATGRRRELAVRAALGASRSRMVRQLLTESVLLGVLGGLVGLAFAYGGLAAIKAAAYEQFFELVMIDRNVLLFTAALSIVTPLLFSLLPALHASKTDLNESLKDSGARTGGGVRGRRSRSFLVVSQLSLAMMLLIVAALLVRTMIAITHASLGFNPSGLVAMRLDVPQWRYGSDAAVLDYYDRLSTRLASLPGVRSVAVTDRLPVLGGESPMQLSVDGYVSPREQDRPWAVSFIAGGGFFTTAGIPIVAGRAFDARDTADAMPVVVINENMARRYWGDPQKALGGRIALDREPQRWLQVIGVSGDIKQPDLTGVNPAIYRAVRQSPQRALSVMVRGDNPSGLIPAIRAELRAIDQDVPVQQLRTIEQAFNEELSSLTILTSMFAAFALIALTLAAAGLYGVISYSVSQRVQEIGIRMALGAVPGDIRRMIVRQTLVLFTVGCVFGLAGGAALARAAGSLLYEVSPSDPSTYLVVALVLSAVAAVSALAPVRRATRIDPLVALRAE
jgi:putative ABC transport system permease protein